MVLVIVENISFHRLRTLYPFCLFLEDKSRNGCMIRGTTNSGNFQQNRNHYAICTCVYICMCGLFNALRYDNLTRKLLYLNLNDYFLLLYIIYGFLQILLLVCHWYCTYLLVCSIIRVYIIYNCHKYIMCFFIIYLKY